MPSQDPTETRGIGPGRLLWWSWALIAIGAAVRIRSWMADASLFIDEAMVSLNVLERGWAELLGPLSYMQVAPPGFLWLQKGVVLVAGDGERALRFVPLAGALIALPVFDRLARRWLSPPASVLALAVFALALPLTFFAAEAKPYSTDVTIAVATLLLADTARRRGLAGFFGLAFALWGALVVWLSYPAVIVLTGAGLVRVAPLLWQRDWRRLLGESPVYAAWAASFGLHWFLSMSVAGDDPFLREFFEPFVLPLAPMSLSKLRILSSAFFRMFTTVLGFPYPAIAGFAFALGWWVVARRNLTAAALAVTPILIAWVLSNREVYPFEERLILYLAPILCLGVGAGAWEVLERTRDRALFISVAFLVVLLAPSIDEAQRRFRNPRQREEIRPVLEYVAAHIAPEDTIYVYYGAQYAYSYYSGRAGLPDGLTLDPFVISTAGPTARDAAPPASRVLLGPSGRKDWNVYVDDLDRLRDRRRVWFIFSHVWSWLGTDERLLLLFYLDRLGAQRLDEITMKGAAAYLYDVGPAGKGALSASGPSAGVRPGADSSLLSERP